MDYIQSLYLSAGNYGCYLFCLINVAEEYLGSSFIVEDVIEQCIDKGFIKFNKLNYNDPDNFYVKEPARVLEYLTGVKWDVRKVYDIDYKKETGEYIIEFWSKDNGATGHFARINRGYNSLQKSYSVDKGKIHSLRVCKVID